MTTKPLILFIKWKNKAVNTVISYIKIHFEIYCLMIKFLHYRWFLHFWTYFFLFNQGMTLLYFALDIYLLFIISETVDWIGIWGKHMKSLMFRAIKDCQKMNHFPGTFQIGRKDRLWRNLQKLVAKYGASEFGIMPKTYVLPQDLKILKHEWEKHVANDERWIVKPVGIFFSY